MNISNIIPINFNYKSLQKPNSFRLKQLSNDVFIKSQSFGSKKQDIADEKPFIEFKKWADETHFFEKEEKPLEMRLSMIGGGFEGTTYEIPGCDKWVIKKFSRCGMLPIHNEKVEIAEHKDIAPKLNIGQIIGRIEIPCGPNYSEVLYVLKKQTGKSYGLAYEDAKCISDTNIKIHLNELKKLSQFPQSSFDKCIDDVSYVQSLGYEFDVANPNNFMLDTDKKNINFVDINDKYNGNGNQYGEVLFGLVDGFFAINLKNSNASEDVKSESEKYINTIIRKYTNAMEKKGANYTSGRFFDVLIAENLVENEIIQNFYKSL